MKLTSYQTSKINDIIQEELQAVLENRRNHSKKPINEFIEESNIDNRTELIKNCVSEKIDEQHIIVSSAEVITKFKNRLMHTLANTLSEHNIADINASEIEMSIEGVGDSLTNLDMKLISSIETAIKEYIDGMCELVMQSFSEPLDTDNV